MTAVSAPAATAVLPTPPSATSTPTPANPIPSPSPTSSSTSAASPLSSISPTDSVWQSLLQRSSRRKDLLPPSTLILLGDRHSGKSTLLSHLDSATTIAQPSAAAATAAGAGGGYVVEYGYVSVRRRDVVDKEEVLGRLNAWSLDDDKHAAALVPLLIQSAHPTTAPSATTTAASTPAQSNPASTPAASTAFSTTSASSSPSAAYTAYSTTAFLVCVDVSDPARLSEQLTRWQQCLLAIRDAAFHHMSKTERANLLHATSLHTQSYYNKDLLTQPPSTANGGSEAAGEAAEAVAEVNPHVPEVNYGASVVVVGTKADVLLGGGGGEVRSGWGGLSGDERLEFAVWLMRHAALQSASTLYLSALPSTSASTIDTLQSYLYHRLYHFPLSSAASTPQPLPSLLPQPTFVPSGYDSAELIEATQVKEGRWKAGMRSDEVFERRRGEGGAGGRAAWRETRGAVVKSVDDSVLFKNIKVQLEGNTSIQLLPPLSTPSSTAPSGHKPRLSTVPSPTTESPASSHPSSPTSSAASGTSSRSKKNKLNPQGQVAVKAFFKSLLQQPGGGSGGSGSGSGGSSGGEVSKRSSMRKDAELELKRISEAAAAGRTEKDKADRGEQKE